MPKETSIGVSKETKKLLKDFKKEINAKSLEEALRLSVGWAKSYNSNFLVAQVELANRLSKVEANQKNDVNYMINLLNIVLALDKRVKKLEEK